MQDWADHARLIQGWVKKQIRKALKDRGINERTIDADKLRGVIDSSVVLPPHAASHEDGGADEMDLGSIAGTINDTQHGGRGGGALHAAATSVAAGFMTAVDFERLSRLTLPANPTTTTITGGGTLALGGFTATIPATGTVILGTGAANRIAYWTGANTLDDHANLQFDPSTTPTTLSLLGLVKFGNVDAYYTGTDNALIYGSLNTGGAFPFLTSGSLILQARASSGRAIVLVTGATPTPRLVVLEGGAVLIGATTGLTGAGDLDATGRVRGDTFETSAGNKWKLLGFTGAADAASNGYVQVTIDGVTYKLSTRA